MRNLIAILALNVITCSTDPTTADNPPSSNQQQDAGTDPTKEPPPTMAGFPAGMLMAFAGATPPAGWWLCDGRAVDSSQYPDLHKVIGSSWGDGGDGDGPLFNLPDLRGRFVRGADNGAGHDPEAKTRTPITQGGNTADRVGSLQDGATALPKKKMTVQTHTGTGTNVNGGFSLIFQVSGFESSDVSGGDIETRPANVAVNWIIKY